MNSAELNRQLRESAIKYILKTDVSPSIRYEAEQMFSDEIEMFIAGAKCAFKMVIDNKPTDTD